MSPSFYSVTFLPRVAVANAHSLVFQLVEYARNLSSLLSSHVATGKDVETQWPTLVDIETEDAWAQRRREFDDSEEGSAEAAALDEAMKQRARR